MKFSVVFAGGGCRAFWSLGAFKVLRDSLPDVDEWAGVSAGAAMAVFSAAHSEDVAMESFVRLTGENERNFYPWRYLTGGEVFPHERMYRQAVSDGLHDDALARLRAGGRVGILHAWVEPGRPPWRTGLSALRAYAGRKRDGVVHGPQTPYPGLGFEVVTAQDLPDAEALVDAVILSSISPPITPIPVVEGRHYVDGGLVDNVPVRALSEEARAGKALVFLTREVPESAVRAVPRRLYLQPSVPVPVYKWDYTSPDLIRRSFDQGREDALAAIDEVSAFVSGQ